jgi:hypothetical protein
MKTISNRNIVLGLLASIALLTVGCGSDGSSSDGAATGASVQTTTLAINLDGAAAIGTTGGSGLRLDGNDEEVVRLDSAGKVLDGKFISVDNPKFTHGKPLVLGDGSMLLGASIPARIEQGASGSVSVQDDVEFSNGKRLMADCKGLIRIKGNETNCAVTDNQTDYEVDGNTFLNDEHFVKTDKQGYVFAMATNSALVKLSPTGVVTKVASSDSELTIQGVTDDSTAVVWYAGSDLIRLHFANGSSKSLEGMFAWKTGNYIGTSAGLYTSKGVKVEITDWQTIEPVALNATDTVIQTVSKGGALYTVDLLGKTIDKVQLGSSQVVSAAFSGDTLYYASVSGVKKVSNGLGLTAAATETAIEGVSDISIFSMTKVGDRVLFSGQSDSNSGYVTGAIEGIEATVNTADSKITSIQSL